MTQVRTRPTTLAVAVVVALSASLALAGVASATKVSSGTTTITAKKGAIKKLKKAGVKVKAADGATKAGKVFTLPITGGDLLAAPYVEAGKAAGTVQTSGDIVFATKKKKVTIGDLLATFSDASTLTSSSGKSGVVFDLGTPSAVSADGLTISGSKAKYAKVLSKALKKKFDVNVKKKTFGTVDVAAVKDPNVTINAGGTTKLTFTPAALANLGSQGPSPIAPATLAPPTLTVPVTGGTLDTQTGFGEVNHDGGIALAGCTGAQGPPLTLDDPSVLIASSGVALNVFSSLTGGRVNIADVTITSNSVSGNTHTLTGDVAINAVAAGALNQACAAIPPALPTPFAAGDPLGTATVEFTTSG